MRLNSLQLVNFRQHADTRIEFDSGLTGIIGPNGAGKTTILEAIAWAMYGNVAARGSRESIRFRRAPVRAPVKVELDFDLGGHRYRIVRSVNGAELYLDGGVAPIANSTRSVTEVVARRLAMTHEEFFNTYFTGQKQLSVMAAMGPSERAQFLSRVLGYERLRDAQTILRDRRSTLVAQATGLRQGMLEPETVLRRLAESGERVATANAKTNQALIQRNKASLELAAIAPRWEAVQRDREQLQEILSELRVSEGEETALGRDLDRLARELTEVSQARAELERFQKELLPLMELEAEYERLETLARDEGRRQALLQTISALDDDLKRARERFARVESAPRLEEEVTLALAAVRKALEEVDGQVELRRTEWVRDRQEAETKRDALRAQYADLRLQRDRLAAAGEDGDCPTCMRPLGQSFQQVLELLDSQIETVRVDGNFYKQRLDQLGEMPDDIRILNERRDALAQEVSAHERRLFKIQSALQDLAHFAAEIASKEERRGLIGREVESMAVGYDAARHKDVGLELDRLSPLGERATRLGTQIEREPQLRRERERVAQQQGLVRRQLAELWARRDAIEVSEAEFAVLRASHEQASRDVHAAELASVAAERDLDAAQSARAMAEAAERELSERQRTLTDLNRRKRLHDETDRAYTDLRTDLNHQLRPELAELAGAFLSELTDNRYSEIDLDEQYNTIVLEDGGPKPVISGGEEDLTNLVLRLAISQMIAERAGQPFSLLILDEIFGSLDDLRRANVIQLLRHLEDRFEQVIIITHVDSVREGLDHVISVRYDDERGCSIVEQPPDALPQLREMDEPVIAEPLEEAGTLQ
ncbi:MAG: AAA family ATPase [Gemmatimonadaceae bacterium]